MGERPPGSFTDQELYLKAKGGQLMTVLAVMPRERWAQRGGAGETLLHLAGLADNVAAARALLVQGLDVNLRDLFGQTPAFYAAYNSQPAVLEVLCAAGADLRERDSELARPLDLALKQGNATCVRVLVANGRRLSTAGECYRIHITPELEAFERGVLRCRAAVVVLLGLKRRRGDVMRTLDRFMVREIACSCWATRSHASWSRVPTQKCTLQ